MGLFIHFYPVSPLLFGLVKHNLQPPEKILNDFLCRYLVSRRPLRPNAPPILRVSATGFLSISKLRLEIFARRANPLRLVRCKFASVCKMTKFAPSMCTTRSSNSTLSLRNSATYLTIESPPLRP